MNKSKNIIILTVLLNIFCLLFCENQAEPPSNFNDSNAGTIGNPYLISNLENLKWLTETQTVWNKHFLQTDDIDALDTINWHNGQGIGPIGRDSYYETPFPFTGIYDGGNYSIFNLYKDVSGDPYWAVRLSLFDYAVGATFRNIRLVDINFTSSNHWVLGGLVYEANFCVINNVSISGNISLTNLTTSAGGTGGSLIGLAINNTIENCSSYVNIVADTLSNNLGGLIGTLHDSILRNSYFHGNIILTKQNNRSGALFRASNRSNISNCYVTSNSEFHNIFAFVGIIENTTIKNSFWDLESTGVPFFAIDILGDQNEIINTYGLPSNEMKQLTIYEQHGWDFDTIWGINSNFNGSYPFLRSQNPNIEHTNEKEISVLPLVQSFAYPNPVRSNQVTVTTNVRKQGLSLHIYNVKGQLVYQSNDFQTRNDESVFVWNTKDNNNNEVASGFYFYKIEEISNNATLHTGKFTIIK